MSSFYDALEHREPAGREAQLLAALPAQVAHAQRASAAMAKVLQGVDAAAVTSRQALARLTLQVEAAGAPEGLDQRVGQAIRDVTKLRAEVQVLAPGSLPNDGKVIEDARSYK